MIREMLEATAVPSAEKLANWKKFVKGMEQLTKSTGFGVQSTGGISYDDPKTIKTVTYSDDESSGDLDFSLKNK